MFGGVGCLGYWGGIVRVARLKEPPHLRGQWLLWHLEGVVESDTNKPCEGGRRCR